MGATARKEKSAIKLSGGRSQISPRADSSVEPESRITLSGDDFDRFEKCMKAQQSPSKLMQEGINLHRKLVGHN